MKGQFFDYIHYRTPLINTYNKLTKEKKLNVVYFGGSITAGFGSEDKENKSWRAKTEKWLKSNFPDAKINAINSSIGESGTYLGVYRLKRDIEVLNPDIIFIEYAVNDLSHDTDYENASMQFETIVREIRHKFPNCDIVTILTEAFSTANDTTLYPAAKGHENISALYSISSILAGKALVNSMHEINDVNWSKYFIDSVHPNDEGYNFYYKVIEEFLCNALLHTDYSVLDVANAYVLPEQCSVSLLDGERIFETAKKNWINNCKKFNYSDDVYMEMPQNSYKGYIYSTDADAEFLYSFYGTEFGIHTNFSHYNFRAQIEYSLNGSEYKRINCALHNPTLVVSNIPVGQHNISIRAVFAPNVPSEFKIAALFTRNSQKATRRNDYI